MLDAHFDLGNIGHSGRALWYGSILGCFVVVSTPFWVSTMMVLKEDETWDMRRTQVGFVAIGIWGRRNIWFNRENSIGRLIDLLPAQVMVIHK